MLLSPFHISPQPDDETCGPTCLHSVYRYLGDPLTFEEVLTGVAMNPTGGTLACNLGCHALSRGYKARLFTYNLMLFDPTWFQGEVDLSEKLRAQAAAKAEPRIVGATNSYLDYLKLGGGIEFRDLSCDLIAELLEQGHPIMAGLSATYLYRSSREIGERETSYDDVKGYPCGHFVVIVGYDGASNEFVVADPTKDHPFDGDHLYRVSGDRMLASILLGVMTYDGNLLVVESSS